MTATSPSREQISEWLVAWIATEAEIPAGDIDLDRSLLDYSLSSITATILVGDIEDWLGLTLPPTLAWDYPTIGALVDFLASESDEQPAAHAAASR